MPSSFVRSLVKPSCLVMLSIASAAMMTGTHASAGSQELKYQLQRLRENSVTRISCSRDQFAKCVQYCIDSQIHTRGSANPAGCRKYCRDASSTQGGCE